MKTAIDEDILDLLSVIPETEVIDQAIIQKTIDNVCKKLNLGAVYVLQRLTDRREYSFRWLCVASEEYQPTRDRVQIKVKDYKAFLEHYHKNHAYSTIFSGKGVKNSVATIGYGFVRTANAIMDGAVGFVAHETHKWTPEEKAAIMKLGRALRRILSGEMLHDTDIQLKMAKTKVEIYRHYTEYDTLTQVPNRHYFVRFCKEYVEKEKRPNVGFLFADLNRLKYINDTLGHPEGDQYIMNFAEKLTKAFGSSTVCRISGDEFIACSTGDSKEQFEGKIAALMTSNIYRGVPQAAIGYTWQDQAENIKDIMNEAESKMYVNKQEFYRNFPEYKR